MAYSALSLNEVINVTGLSKQAIEKKIEQGLFPPAIPLGPWAAGWSQRDIESWVAQHKTST